MRRRAIVGFVSLLVMVFAASAAAYWHAGGTGTGQAPVEILAAGNQPTTSANLSTVTVRWMQTALQGSPLGGYSGGGYAIRRYPASGGAAVTPNGGCATTISGTTATLSCQESGVPAGSWRYTVTPLLGTWTGAESPQSASVTVAPAASTLTSVAAQNPASGQTTGNIQVGWSAATGATGYNVYRRTSSGAYDFSAPLNGAVPLTGTTYSDPGSGLTGGTTYAYVVRATSGAESANSNELSATAIARPPAPASVTATPAAGGQINVGWSSVSGVAGYNVYRRTTTGAYNYATPLNGASPATGTTFSDTSTVHGTTYRYVTRAVTTGAGGAQVESVDSSESPTATADATPPSSVTLTDPGSPLRGSVTLSGAASDSGSGVASVRFQYAPAGGSTWTDGCTTTTAPYSCSLATGALTDGLYDLRVLASDAAGNTMTSSVVANRRVDNTAPSVTMGDPGAFLRGTTLLTTTADDGAGAGITSVRLQRSLTDAGSWTDICTDASAPFGCSLDTTVLNNAVYDLRAIATDAAGNVSTSQLVTVEIDNAAPTITMSNPGATISGTITLVTSPADADSGVVRVTIQRKATAGSTWVDVCVIATAPWSCAFNSLAVPDGSYDFRATALDAAGNSTTSSTWSARAVDNTTVSSVSLVDPGTFLRGTVALQANASAIGGIGNIVIQRFKAGGAWTDICTDTTSPYSCTFDTTSAATPDGAYDLRAVMTSSLGVTTISAVVAGRIIDNTLVRGVDVQAANKPGGTPGRLEPGDTLTLTYGEAMQASTLISGWSATGPASLSVRLTDASNAETITLAPGLGTIAPGGNYAGKNKTVTFAATATLSSAAGGGSIVTIVLGTPSGTGLRTQLGAVAMKWTPSSTATDLAGNGSSTATVTESGTIDRDF